jgi:hypothetical protein
MKAKVGKLFFFLFAWALMITVPHFQQESSVPNSLFCLLLALISFLLFRSLLEVELSPKIISLTLLAIPSVYLVALSFFYHGSDFLYHYWSRFGAGSMVLGSSMFPFGDLAQLVFAADCKLPPVIGENICDPWERPLNQNPFVVELFRFIKFSNLPFVGVASTLLFFFVTYLFNRNHKMTNFTVPLFLVSPVAILAVERGNELITLTLILGGFLLLEKEKLILQPLGAILLGYAAIFKLWPVIIIVAMLVLSPRYFRVLTRLLLSVPIIYWILNLNLAKIAVQNTQLGSPSGVSFGAKLFLDVRIPALLQLFYIALLFVAIFFLIRYFARDKSIAIQICNSRLEAVILISVFLTYFCIWILGQSFMYRLLLLLPALLVLVRPHNWNYSASRFLVSLVLLTSFSAKLQISIVLTGVLACVGLYLAIILTWKWTGFKVNRKYLSG